jgi:hypothetical protein
MGTMTHADKGHAASPVRFGAARLGWFLRHLAEMTVVMAAGMVAGAVGFFLVTGLSPEEAFVRVPVLFCLVIAAGSVLPMVAWMRHRGHDWGSCSEMAVAMVLPLAPIFALYWLGVIPGTACCGLYCASMVPAMLAAMLYRHDWYTGHAGHVAHAA